jgi:hypothetical protein
MSDVKDPAAPDDSRREFLRRILRTAGYVPPAIIAMGMGNMAAAQATPPAMMMMMMSDRDSKTAVADVDAQEILDRLASLPVPSWNYRSEDPAARHLGPMAQDFRKAFELGSDERQIHVVDASGVALASIQALYAIVREQKTRIDGLEARLDELKRRAAL